MSKRGLKLRFLFATAYPESAGRSLLVANDILSLFFLFFFIESTACFVYFQTRFKQLSSFCL